MRVNSLHWYYTPSLGEKGDLISLAGDEWHHCYNVMRMKTGDSLMLVDGIGHCVEGIILDTSQRSGTIEVTEILDEQFRIERNYHISIAMAPTKNLDRTEFAAEKMVELGVDEISFLDCRHGERTHLRTDRLSKIVISAAKQSRKTVFSVLHGMSTPYEFIKRKKSESPDTTILACHLDGSSSPVFDNYLPGKDVVLMIGPEGGFSAEELEMMKQENVKFVHLGPYHLRVETAAITACADIHLINQMKLSS